MRMALISFGIPRRVHIRSVDPDEDELFETVVKRGKKIASASKELDQEVVDQLKEHKVTRLWVRQKRYQWVSRRQARERNANLEKVEEINVDVAKAILKLAEVDEIYGLAKLIKTYLSLDIDPPTKQQCKNILKELKELKPEVEKFRRQLNEIEDKKTKHKVIRLMQKNPENISPRAFPRECENLGRNYLEYLCRFYKQHFEMARVIFRAGPREARKLGF